MARSDLHQRRVQLTPAQQIGRMRSKFPDLAVAFKRDGVVWTGDWWPHPLSDTYRIQVSYTVGRRPRIAVLTQDLNLQKARSDCRMCIPMGRWIFACIKLRSGRQVTLLQIRSCHGYRNG